MLSPRPSVLLRRSIVVRFQFVSGCHSGGHRGVTVSLTIPVVPYLQSQFAGAGKAKPVADFPTLEVFDRTGQAVYQSHNAGRNAELLRSLPQAMNGLKTLPGRATLSEVVETFSGVAEKDRKALLDHSRPTVLSLSLEDCHACTLQEETLGPEMEKSLAADGFNLVVIRLSRPK
jgi:hypothetical protein